MCGQFAWLTRRRCACRWWARATLRRDALAACREDEESSWSLPCERSACVRWVMRRTRFVSEDGRRQSSLCSARTRRRLLHERHEPCRRRFRPPAVVGRGWTLPWGLWVRSPEKGVTEGTTGFLFIPALTAHAREGWKKGRAGLPSSRRPAPLARPGRAR